MRNEQRAETLIKKYGFNFQDIPKHEIRELIEAEILDFKEGSSEYIRLLCGYLYCIGDCADVDLSEKAKYGINMDVGCMIDGEWIDSLKEIEDEYMGSREEIVKFLITTYNRFWTLLKVRINNSNLQMRRITEYATCECKTLTRQKSKSNWQMESQKQ